MELNRFEEICNRCNRNFDKIIYFHGLPYCQKCINVERKIAEKNRKKHHKPNWR